MMVFQCLRKDGISPHSSVRTVVDDVVGFEIDSDPSRASGVGGDVASSMLRCDAVGDKSCDDIFPQLTCWILMTFDSIANFCHLHTIAHWNIAGVMKHT